MKSESGLNVFGERLQYQRNERMYARAKGGSRREVQHERITEQTVQFRPVGMRAYIKKCWRSCRLVVRREFCILRMGNRCTCVGNRQMYERAAHSSEEEAEKQ
jgi:hypothetical protein